MLNGGSVKPQGWYDKSVLDNLEIPAGESGKNCPKVV